MYEHTFRAMGSGITMLVESASPPDLAAAEQWFHDCERSLSRFNPASELSQLNTQGALSASPILWAALDHALAAARWSAGLVTPTVLSALEAHGYSASFDQLRPSAGAPVARPASAWQAITCEPSTRHIQLPPGVRIDLGGTAKGWAADQAAALLAPGGSVLVDAGGDIALAGAAPAAGGWPIGVPHPLDEERQLALLWLASGGVATSGRDFRRWQQADRWQHHLIDPATGAPSASDVLSATVVGPNAAAADVAAKIVLLLGRAAGLDWLDARPDFAGLVVLDDGRAAMSQRFADYCWPNTFDALLAGGPQ